MQGKNIIQSRFVTLKFYRFWFVGKEFIEKLCNSNLNQLKCWFGMYSSDAQQNKITCNVYGDKQDATAHQPPNKPYRLLHIFLCTCKKNKITRHVDELNFGMISEQEDSKYHLCYDRNRNYPDSKVHGANMGPIWGRQDPGGPHVGRINFAIWVTLHIWKYIYGTWIKSICGKCQYPR